MTGISMTTPPTNRAWLHEPSTWSETGKTLTVTVPPGTDYWRITHYGFITIMGRFATRSRRGNFEAKVRISGKIPRTLSSGGLDDPHRRYPLD